MRQLQRAAAVDTADARRAARPHRVDEILELEPQRLGVGHRQLAAVDARAGVADHDLVELGFLLREIDADVGARLEERTLRIVSKLMRLAVRLAMQPEAKVRRTLAMSMRGDSTGTPTASMAVTSLPMAASSTSRSWIIRSNTTSMSRLRSRKPLSRCTSTNPGDFTCGRAATTAGLKRSEWPTASTAP